MERLEKLEKLAEVLFLAAQKASELSTSGLLDGRASRSTALSVQIEGIALEFRAMASELKSRDPKEEQEEEA